jgi:tellurite resistance protein
MAEKDGITEDVRKREEEYFRRKDRELIEKMRQAAVTAQSRKDMEQKTGIHDPALLTELEDLGFTPETCNLLPLVPVLQVAWAEGGISDAERKLIVQLARARGIESGSVCDDKLNAWLASRPSNDTFSRATRLIRAMLDRPEDAHMDIKADDLVTYAEQIAAASGGVFGFGKVSAEERAALAQISSALKQRS